MMSDHHIDDVVNCVDSDVADHSYLHHTYTHAHPPAATVLLSKVLITFPSLKKNAF